SNSRVPANSAQLTDRQSSMFQLGIQARCAASSMTRLALVLPSCNLPHEEQLPLEALRVEAMIGLCLPWDRGGSEYGPLPPGRIYGRVIWIAYANSRRQSGLD